MQDDQVQVVRWLSRNLLCRHQHSVLNPQAAINLNLSLDEAYNSHCLQILSCSADTNSE